MSDETSKDELTDGSSEKNHDFSKFFNDAAQFGGDFHEIVDEELESIMAEVDTFSFADKKKPKVDENGMIVIYDEEEGIDATDMPEAERVKLTYSGKSVGTEKTDEDSTGAEKTDADSSDDDSAEHDRSDFGTDDNLSSDDGKEDGTEKKKGFLSGILPAKGDSAGEVIRKIVFLVSTAVFIGAGVMLASTLLQQKEAQQELEDIKEMVTTTVATTINEEGVVETIPPTSEEREEHNESLMNSFAEVSDKVKGFIELPGCDIYYPVVQWTDNDYYLTHTYDDRINKAGAIFMDYRCVLSEEYISPNIVLYGHNQEDGTMFGNLKDYKNNVDFYKENPFVTFSTEYGVGDYVIFGYFITNVYPRQDLNGEVFHYHDYINVLEDEVTFNWYMEQIDRRNQIIPTVDVAFGDQLLVLSTCSNEYSDSRFVVMARRFREGETRDSFDFSAAKINPYAKKIDWDAILYGRTNPPSDTTTAETTTESVTTTTPATTTTPEETTTKKRRRKTETTVEETTTEVITTTTEVTTTTEETTTEETTVPEETTETTTTTPYYTTPAYTAPEHTPAPETPAPAAPAPEAPAGG
ncbi:MAG: class B sortase [Oscillospiraceae bacterium]|nr:class B sortase [Oscillospiraceae bacterium]